MKYEVILSRLLIRRNYLIVSSSQPLSSIQVFTSGINLESVVWQRFFQTQPGRCSRGSAKYTTVDSLYIISFGTTCIAIMRNKVALANLLYFFSFSGKKGESVDAIGSLDF